MNKHSEHAGHAGGSGTHAGNGTMHGRLSRDRHAGHSVAMFRDKFWLSFVLTIPTIVWSPEVAHWFRYRPPTFPGSTLIPPILGTVIFFYGGLVFLRGARGEIADRQPGMMTLISLGILVAFAALLPDTAERIDGAEIHTVPAHELKVGDIVLVRPGTRVPADGVVVDGTADVDESMITGESRTVPRGPGGPVIAGTVVSGGSLRVRVTAVGEQTTLSGI